LSKTKGFSKRLSDEDVIGLLLMIDPELTHIEISQKFPDSHFLLLTKEGASFEGAIVGSDERCVQLRQADGQIIFVRKDVIAAVRRPANERR
jgi:hypothetical protein